MANFGDLYKAFAWQTPELPSTGIRYTQSNSTAPATRTLNLGQLSSAVPQPKETPPIGSMSPVSTMWGSRPDIVRQLSEAGISELPSWIDRYVGGNWKEHDFLNAWEKVNSVNPWDYYKRTGKLGKAANQAFGLQVALGNMNVGDTLSPQTVQDFQQIYLDKVLKENHGGFGLSEALGLGSIALPIMGAAAIPALVGGGAAAGVGGAAGGAAAGVGGAAGGAAGASGLGGLSGPELVALMGGGSGVAAGGAGGSGVAAGGAGGAGMGIWDSISGALSDGWGNALQGGLGVLGSYLGGQQVKEGYDKSADVLMRMYSQNRSDMEPLLALLKNYAGEFSDVASRGGVDYTNDPIYQADKAEMLRTLRRGQASRGLLNSSDTENAITRNMSTLMNNAYARKYGGLLDLMKLGSGAASSAGSFGANTGNALSGVYGAQGNAAANTIGGMFGAGMGALNNYQLMNLLMAMKR